MLTSLSTLAMRSDQQVFATGMDTVAAPIREHLESNPKARKKKLKFLKNKKTQQKAPIKIGVVHVHCLPGGSTTHARPSIVSYPGNH